MFECHHYCSIDSYHLNKFSNSLEIQLKKIFQHFNDVESTKEMDLEKRLSETQNKIDRLNLRFGLEEIPSEVNYKTKPLLEKELLDIKVNLNNVKGSLSNQDLYVEKSLDSLRNISTVWSSIDLSDKQKLQNLLFPEGMYTIKKITVI